MKYSGVGYVSAKSDLPMLAAGGDVVVEWNTGMMFDNNYTTTMGGVVTPLGSVVVDNGEVSVAVGSILKVVQGLLMSDGVLDAYIPADVSTGESPRRAWIDGKLTVTGGLVTFDYADVGQSGLQAYLSVTQNIVWSGGTYKPYIDTATPEERSEWRCDGTFTIQGTAPLISPFNISPGVDPVTGKTWTIIHADGGVTGTPTLAGTAASDFDLVQSDFQRVLKAK